MIELSSEQKGQAISGSEPSCRYNALAVGELKSFLSVKSCSLSTSYRPPSRLRREKSSSVGVLKREPVSLKISFVPKLLLDSMLLPDGRLRARKRAVEKKSMFKAREANGGRAWRGGRFAMCEWTDRKSAMALGIRIGAKNMDNALMLLYLVLEC